MVKVCGTYEIVNLANQTRYLGSSTDIPMRFSSHRSTLRRGTHRNGHFQNAWNKYGEQSFAFRILQETPVETKLVAEQELLDKAFGDKIPLYNISRTADAPLFGRHLSDEVKKKISEKNTGKKRTEEQNLRKSESQKGKKRTEETKRKMSLAHLGKPKSAEHIKHMSEANLGKIMSEETRKKLSAALKGRVGTRLGTTHTAATKLKMSLARAGRPKSPEHVAAVAASIRRNAMTRRFLQSPDSIISCLI